MVQQSRYYDGLQKMIEKLEKEENIIVDVQVVPDAESLNMIKMKLNSGELRILSIIIFRQSMILLTPQATLRISVMKRGSISF